MLHSRGPITIWLILILAAAVSLSGCGGCRKAANNQGQGEEEESEEEKKKKEEEEKEKKKKKKDFEFAQLKVLPGGNIAAVKPGHWTAASQQMVANNFDFNGELMSAAVDKNGQPLTLELTSYRMQMTRPVTLAKEQKKHIEMNVFVPRRTAGPRPNVVARLTHRGTGRTVNPTLNPTYTMAPHEYFLVGLARSPDSYKYLTSFDTVRVERGGFNQPTMHYRVDLPQLDKRVPLPSSPLMWTSIAYIIWDDIDPDLLSIDQQDALVDWIHWGGGLIISGPGSLETLRTSFLADYLPAESKGTVQLEQSAFDEINQHFTLPLARGDKKPLTVLESRLPEGLDLKLHREADPVAKTGGLVIERPVGRGRVTLTSFSLTNPQIVNWVGFDGFFNACILRRPAREFVPDPQSENFMVRWADPSIAHAMHDPRLVSNLRYFTRDMGFLGQTAKSEADRARAARRRFNDPNAPFDGAFSMENVEDMLANPDFAPENLDDGPQFELPTVDDTAELPAGEQAPWQHSPTLLPHRGFHATPQSGVAGWNDNSGGSHAARESLREAAGITVPKRDFVLRIVGIYLLVLVPVNWGFFRLIGRVEWAWIAAPIIAIAGAVAVVRMAELDIGFARSRTEIAVLELQGEHHRGHLTRYTALYTSLSTGYDAQFDSATAVSQPFALDSDFQKLKGQGTSTVTFRNEKQQVGLRGYQVRSNSTGMLHSEQMHNIGGGLVLTGSDDAGWQIDNRSDLTIKDVGLIRRWEDPDFGGEHEVQVAWIGELEGQTKAEVKFGRVQHQRALLPEWENSPITSTRKTEGEVSLLKLLDLARDPRRMLPGDVKLIGWTDMELEGLDISPRASQSLYRTLVVANLRYAEQDDPQPDKNTRQVAKAQAMGRNQ